MVTATKGLLIRCDVPTKVFIIHLDETKPSNERFVIDANLDDTALLIKPTALDMIKEELKKHKLAITYQAPFERKLA